MKIEDLADDFQQSANISGPDQPLPGPDLLTQALQYGAAKDAAKDGTATPALPPALAAARSKTGDEMLAELNKSPLFMTELEENDELEAIKALAYEGTPLEVAAGFKERGNEAFREKKWADAKEFYTRSINVLLIEVRKRQRGEETEGSEADVKEQVKVLEASLINRAACHLELKNYRSCTLDCASVLRFNASNVKAFYRSSKALLALGRIEEADDACARGLQIDPENGALKVIARDIIKRNQELQARQKRELEREQRRLKEAYTLKAALKARGIKTRKTAQPPEMENVSVCLVPDPVSPESTLQFPVILLYPLHLESDFIKAYNELDSLAQHLDYIFPLPWDTEGLYTTKGVETYMETASGGLVKVGRKVNLLKILSEGNVEVVDEVIRIFVVPKQRSAEWIADWKRKKGLERAS